MNEEQTTMKPTRYFDLNEAEKLSLSAEQMADAVKIEAIHRGIKIPYTLGELADKIGCRGFTLPADVKIFHEIVRPKQYSGTERTGLCFASAEAARKALDGAICIIEDGYPVKRNKIVEGEWTTAECYVTLFPITTFATKLQEAVDDEPSEEFTKLAEECSADLGTIRQRIYDNEVRQRKRKEYMRLAQGNEEIAQAFWRKAESGDFPAEVAP